ncbi:TPA: hypothetical protein O2M69_002407 [Staphylococcus aureus]|nr:hypothetical protein [Staphylococcus aureus]
MNAIPKIYDEEKNEWVELVTKPIAEEVVRIMEDNFMKNKGQIKLLKLPYGKYYKEQDVYEYTSYMFYNSKVSQKVVDEAYGTLKGSVQYVYDSLPEKRELTYNDLKQEYSFRAFEKAILGFNVLYQDEFGSTAVVHSKDVSELELYNVIGSYNFTVSYIFNDNPIEKNQFVHKAY